MCKSSPFYLHFLFTFLFLFIFLLYFYYIFINDLISRRISSSAFWCPVTVLGCAAMISWTRAARFVPIHPCDAGSSGMSWRIYFRSCFHFWSQCCPSVVVSPPLPHPPPPLGVSDPPWSIERSSAVGGRYPQNTIAMIPKIPQYPGLYVSLP